MRRVFQVSLRSAHSTYDIVILYHPLIKRVASKCFQFLCLSFPFLSHESLAQNRKFPIIFSFSQLYEFAYARIVSGLKIIGSSPLIPFFYNLRGGCTWKKIRYCTESCIPLRRSLYVCIISCLACLIQFIYTITNFSTVWLCQPSILNNDCWICLRSGHRVFSLIGEPSCVRLKRRCILHRKKFLNILAVKKKIV